ncbi:thy-1 membrane glycoprotein isoform 1-T1 [Mergus octosetaceus]
MLVGTQCSSLIPSPCSQLQSIVCATVGASLIASLPLPRLISRRQPPPGHLISGKMNPTVGIAVILTVLQAAQCQMIKDLSACLLGQSLRVDCRYENKTSNPLTYEFSITKDNRKHVIHSTISVSENVYRSRANVTMHKNLVCLYLQSFTTSDEGVYMCELKATNDYTGNQIKNITVIKDKLEKCAGFSLLIQNTSWLLLLLLSLPLLQAVDFVSL